MRSGRLLPVLAALPALSCGDGSPLIYGTCGGYVAPASAAYVLPYPVGESYVLSQGNCSSFSHNGDSRYAYDFSTPIGTTVVAARAGTVIEVEESFPDGNGGTQANVVAIRHADGTVARYAHLTQNGVTVSMGASVAQGDSIGLSGNSGYSTGAHLHFEVYRDSASPASIPVTFSNAGSGAVFPLRVGAAYQAL